MLSALLLTALLLSAQQPEKIALVFGPKAEDVEIVKLSEVGNLPELEKKYGSRRVNAARMIAVATLIENKVTLTPEERKACLAEKICMCCQ